MINKKLLVVTVAAALAVSTATIFASGWQKNNTGWWFGTNDANTSWHANGWQWLDGNGDGVAECYYFDVNGYALTNTTTPDGYQVNSDGAWTVNGVVQTQSMSTSTSSSASSSNTGSTTATDDTWPIVTQWGTADWSAKVKDSTLFPKIASQFVFDNGGYNEWGISNAAVDMLTHTREENKKYGELYVIEENPESYNSGARITYKNGMTVQYAHTNKLKRGYSTARVYLDDLAYPILKNKMTYIFKYSGDDDDTVKKNLLNHGFASKNLSWSGVKTDQQFTFDGNTFYVLASYTTGLVWGD